MYANGIYSVLIKESESIQSCFIDYKNHGNFLYIIWRIVILGCRYKIKHQTIHCHRLLNTYIYSNGFSYTSKMGNCFSKSASDESEPAASRENSLVLVGKFKVLLLHDFKRKMLGVEDFKFDKHPLVIEYMSADVRQSFGELYGGRQWPPTAEWVARFNENWTPFRKSMAPLYIC